MSQPTAFAQLALTKRERFLRAIRKQPVDRPPVWLMRQAGRYLPEYQKIKKNHSFRDVCLSPELAAEISIQPYEILGVDAIIVFNDILIPFEDMGFSVTFTDQGPELEPAVRSQEQLERLHTALFPDTPPVFDTIEQIRRHVGPDVPVLGFVGAPFTMASYAVEGRMSKNLASIRALRYFNPTVLKRLLDLITETLEHYLSVQIEAGADAIQIFDTWASVLAPVDYDEFALPYQKRLVRAAQERGVPAILYVNGCAPHILSLNESGADVLSIDWRIDLRRAYDRVGGRCALQGNLDPASLCGPPNSVAFLTRAMLDGFGKKTGHVANLGHGVLPQTPVESVQAFVETVQGYEYGHSL